MENKVQYRRIVFLIGGFLLVGLISLGAYQYNRALVAKQMRLEREAKSAKEWRMSLLNGDPKPLQENFSKDVEQGTNDMYTKSDAYFVTHRYFDTGGNIYEIYDFIESKPSLSFLKEAENIYPESFEKIRQKALPTIGNDDARYAYLAYVEVLKNHGYTDIAAIGTAANQYAKTAYFSKIRSGWISDEVESAQRRQYVDRDIQKAVEFINISRADVSSVLDGNITSNDIPARDILVGLNQYAAALRYLEALNIQVDSTKTSRQIFAFTSNYAQSYVPEIMHFTALLDASTLSMLSGSDAQEIKAALYPILDFDTRKMTLSEKSILRRIIDARLEKDPEHPSKMDLDVYSKYNILTLAQVVPDFRLWLVSNGWSEQDFEDTLQIENLRMEISE